MANVQEMQAAARRASSAYTAFHANMSRFAGSGRFLELLRETVSKMQTLTNQEPTPLERIKETAGFAAGYSACLDVVLSAHEAMGDEYAAPARKALDKLYDAAKETEAAVDEEAA